MIALSMRDPRDEIVSMYHYAWEKGALQQDPNATVGSFFRRCTDEWARGECQDDCAQTFAGYVDWPVDTVRRVNAGEQSAFLLPVSCRVCVPWWASGVPSQHHHHFLGCPCALAV